MVGSGFVKFQYACKAVIISNIHYTKYILSYLVCSEDGLDHARDKLLRDLDQVVVVGVGHVELASRELGVVGHVNALVSTTTTNSYLRP